MATGKNAKQTLGDITASVRHVHLDSENPRHDPLDSDAKVIAELCAEGKILPLADDIATLGSLSPLERLGVIPMEGNPGHYISVEGNRRTCALILLHDPKRAPTPELQAQFREAASGRKVPRELKIHVFSSREAAKPWIDRRHLGQQGGVGTLPWDAVQQARAAGTNTKTSARANTLSLAVLDRLSLIGAITPEQREAASLTTLTRYLGTPGVRAKLGLGSSKELLYTHDEDEVERGLRWLVLDSITPQADGTFLVNSRSGSEDRLRYANSLQARGVAPVTPLDSPVPPTVPAAKGAAKKRSAIDPSKRRTLFSSNLTISFNDPVLLRLRKEALTVDLEECPFSGNFVLRALVERIMILFLKKRGKYSVEMSDLQLSQKCAEEMRAAGMKGAALTTIQKAAGNADQPHSLHSLGHAVHGGLVPTRTHLRGMADTWEASLRAMLGAL